MDKTQLQQKISEYFSKLPKDAQDIFSSMKWVDSVSEASTKYNLSDKQKEDLATETSMALLGIIHLDQYENSLINDIGIKKETADMLIADLDKSIFSAIRPSLSNAFADNVEKIAKEKYGKIDKLDERFAGLSPEVKDAITNSQYQKNLYTIAGKYTLKMDEMSALDEITTKVMLGIISNDEYGIELSKSIKIPEDKMALLVADVNDMVFKSIRSFLVKKVDIKPEIKKIEENPVPIPPYKKTDSSKPINNVIPEDKVANEKEMESSGVEIIQDKATERPQEEKVTMREDSIMVKSGVSVMPDITPQKESHILPNNETQKSVLYGIENPPTIKNIMEMKLNSSVNKNITNSVHTLSNTPLDTQKQSSVVHDPYHEQI